MSSHPVDDLAVYALDALDDVERRAVDEHLADCPDCRLELDTHYETLVALVPDEPPPPAVWEGVVAAITAPDDASEIAQEPVPAPVIRLRRPWLAAAGGLVAAAIVGGVLGFALGRSHDDGADIDLLAEQAAEDRDGVLATLDDTAGQPVARVVADADGAYVVLEGLRDLPEGRAYQLWSLTGPKPVSLGMLGRDGTNTVAFRLPPTITKVAISVAPTSGDVAPNGAFQASGTITHAEA